MKKWKLFLFLLILIFVLLSLGQYFHLQEYLKFSYLKENQQNLNMLFVQNPLIFSLSFFVIYVLVTAISFPGATILTLAGGAIFGLTQGFIIISFASSIGATLAFLFSRYFFKDMIQNKFQSQLQTINEGIIKDGASYLFGLRLIPAFPFFVINLVMGLTPMKTLTYYFTSQVGMLPGTLLYINAGQQLASLENPKDIFSAKIFISFTLLAFFPIISKKIVQIFKNKKIYKKFKRPSHFDYNMIVLGAGSGGLVTAYICAAVKAKVALIEKHAMGGDCLNTGCVPSKALIKSAKVAWQAKNASEFGIHIQQDSLKIHFKEIMQRIQTVIKKIEPHDSIERYTNLGVDCIEGEAKIISPWEVEVNGKKLTTANITIATGAKPFVPPIDGINQINFLTSDNLWQLQELPDRFVILGGGPIGLEMAQSFQRLGSKVTVIEMLDRIMTAEDPDVSSIVQKKLESEGVEFLLGHKAIAFHQTPDGKKFIKTQHQGQLHEVSFDQVLVAVGRKPNVKGFGLETLDIKLRDNGSIEASPFMQTNFPNIFVCGDVTGPIQLTHAAAHQAWYCAVNSLFGKLKSFKIDYRVLPWCTYVAPEVASVGLNETRAKKSGIEYQLTSYEIEDLDRAIADGLDHGVVRVLTKPGTDEILGATIVSNRASEMLLEFTLAMKYKIGLNKILSTIHPYPTMGEANKYLAGNWKKANTSPKILKLLEKWHNFMRS